jgi:excisionase family DNA binding protein
MSIESKGTKETSEEHMDEVKYLSPDEVGKMFRASKWTVRRWVDAGRLPAVRLGRRLLIPAEAVEKLVEQQLSPSDLKEASHVTLSFVREPTVRHDYFVNSFGTAELSKLSGVIITTLRAGGWPYDTYELKKEGVKQIILGEKTAPPAIWRYLCSGIEALSAAAVAAKKADEIDRTRE